MPFSAFSFHIFSALPSSCCHTWFDILRFLVLSIRMAQDSWVCCRSFGRHKNDNQDRQGAECVLMLLPAAGGRSRRQIVEIRSPATRVDDGCRHFWPHAEARNACADVRAKISVGFSATGLRPPDTTPRRRAGSPCPLLLACLSRATEAVHSVTFIFNSFLCFCVFFFAYPLFSCACVTPVCRPFPSLALPFRPLRCHRGAMTEVWSYLHERYGGGPVICRGDPDGLYE